MSRLTHPNLVRLVGFSMKDPMAMIMEVLPL